MNSMMARVDDMHVRFVGGTMVRIVTSFDYPPIPVRSNDWSAVTDDYDCDCDQDGFFSTHPVGRGASEDDAILDLMIQLEEAEEDRAANGQFGVGA